MILLHSLVRKLMHKMNEYSMWDSNPWPPHFHNVYSHSLLYCKPLIHFLLLFLHEQSKHSRDHCLTYPINNIFYKYTLMPLTIKWEPYSSSKGPCCTTDLKYSNTQQNYHIIEKRNPFYYHFFWIDSDYAAWLQTLYIYHSEIFNLCHTAMMSFISANFCQSMIPKSSATLEE